MRGNPSRSTAFLRKDLQRLLSQPSTHYSIGVKDNDLHTWQILIIGPAGTLHENAIYNATMKFPSTYPDDPPEFVFQSEMFHPNISTNGIVCISILHKGDDIYGYEERTERWLPVRSPDSIIMSIILLLNDPNCESPANIDAARMYTEKRNDYNKIVKKLAQKTLE